MAWLHATPKPPEGSKRAKFEANTKRVSRLDKMKADKIMPSMPPNPAPHIIDRLVEIGLSEAAGMGVAPLSWREINEWQRATCVTLPPWEARLIRKLSTEYIAEGRRAEDDTYPSPWRAPVTQREIDTEAAGIRALMGSFK